MKIIERLQRSIDFWFVVTVSFIFFLLRLPSLFEPNWYGDEGIYQVLGIGMNAGRLLYRDIFDNKPPLLYFLYSLVSSDFFSIRLLSLIFGLLAILSFYLLSKKLFQQKKARFIATAFFAILFGLPLMEGNIANAENFMLFPNILSALFILKTTEKISDNLKKKYLIVAGLTLGISFLFKVVGVFDFAAFFVFLIFSNNLGILEIIKWGNVKQELRRLVPFVVSFLTPIALVFLFFVFKGASSYFLKAVLFNNIGYVNYGNQFIIPQGLLIFKLFLLLNFILFIFLKRKTFGNAFTFVSIWLGFSLFSTFFSQRPYTHYMLVLLPSFCLMIGLFYLKQNFSKLSGIFAISVFILMLLTFNFYLKTIFYYPNFASFLLGYEKVSKYQSFFDGNTPRDYELANYIKSHSNDSDNIFIWGNNAEVYQLTNKLPPGRYAVEYHIKNYKDGFENTKEGLLKQKPKFIILMPNVASYPFSLLDYSLKININGANIYEKIFD